MRVVKLNHAQKPAAYMVVSAYTIIISIKIVHEVHTKGSKYDTNKKVMKYTKACLATFRPLDSSPFFRVLHVASRTVRHAR